MNIHYSVILAFMGQMQDRFATYQEPRGLAEKLRLTAKIEGVRGIEAVYPPDFQGVNPETFRQLLDENGLAVSSVNVNVKSEQRFHLGALTSRDPGIRAEALQYLKAGMDWAAELGVNLVTVCPLSDGHDYPFEIDYGQAWRWLVECLGEAASYRPEVRLSVEYKQSEPRARVIVPNAGVVLHLCEQIGLDNVGLTVDLGHALYAGETPAQVLSLAADAKRLLPIELLEAARIDGASRLRAMVVIDMPLVLPGAISMFFFAFTLSWGEYMYALTFMSQKAAYTVPLGMVNEAQVGDLYYWGKLMAGAVLGSVPVVIIYSFLMDYYLAGMTAGAVKG